MPSIEVIGIYPNHISETHILAIRPIVKFSRGYLKLLNSDPPMPLYEYISVDVTELDLEDCQQSVLEFDHKIVQAMQTWNDIGDLGDPGRRIVCPLIDETPVSLDEDIE